MNLAKSVFCWTILSFFICAEIYSQENRGQFSGRVVDSAKIPIRLATVGIYRQDSTIKQTLTDSAGSYTLTADTGIYWLKVSSA
ncbi:MAG: carboxypeptidase-like regulatory domain-containing protein, partial [Bacteroidota bacterium]|nr:carboxypeptidase-like regulatory domain-containing protein [Bacteroidota bacterium]